MPFQLPVSGASGLSPMEDLSLYSCGEEDSAQGAKGWPAPQARVHFPVTRLIMEAGVKLGMKSIPIATACAIYHKFFCETNVGAYVPYLVAMSALYLAGKVEEQPLRACGIINVSNRYFHPGSEPLELDSGFWVIPDSIVQCELLVLRVLRFQVSFQHPHRYLLHYLISLKNWLNPYIWQRAPISVTAWALLQDSYRGGLCLRFQAQHIAVAVLHLALQVYGVEVPAQAEAEKPWWQVFSDKLTKPIIEDIVSALSRIYTVDTEIPEGPGPGLSKEKPGMLGCQRTAPPHPCHGGSPEHWLGGLVLAAGDGAMKAMTCCHVDSQVLTVPGSHGPDGDRSCTSQGQKPAGGGSESSGSALVL